MYLGIVRSIKVFSLRILSGASVIPPDNKVCGTEVLPYNGMPNCFPWSSHSHSERKKCEMSHAIGIHRHDRLVHTDSSNKNLATLALSTVSGVRVMVDISRLCQTDDGMDKHVGLSLTRCTNCELTMGPVHRVTRLVKVRIVDIREKICHKERTWKATTFLQDNLEK
jgi:hypothetical protein